MRILDYEEHAVGKGADATAISYVEIQVGESAPTFGVGMDQNIVTASLNAITSAINRAIRAQGGMKNYAFKAGKAGSISSIRTSDNSVIRFPAQR